MNTAHAKIARITATLLASLWLLGLAATANAESRLDRIQVQSSLEVACTTPRVPGQQEIGRLFEVANFSKTYELRARLQHIVTRACHSGADRVLIAIQKQADHAELNYVALND